MANLQASDSCLQTAWSAGQAKGSSLAAHGSRKNGAGGKSAGKRLLKRAAKHSVDLDDYEEQDHLDACFKDSDYGERCAESLTLELAFLRRELRGHNVPFKSAQRNKHTLLASSTS